MGVISNQDLMNHLENLAAKEHQATVQFLGCLGELDRRRAYLELGYSSSFALCTGRLRYSEPAAYRRISAARAIRDFPLARRLLEGREVSLTSLALVHPILRAENAAAILGRIAGRGKEEIERIVAEYKAPLRVTCESVRAIAVAAPAQSLTFSGEGASESGEMQQAVDVKFKLNFAVDGRIMSKLKRLKELRPYQSLEEIFEALIDEYLKRKAPENKRGTEVPSVSRSVPSGLRATILKRDNYQCSFVGSAGARCGCRSDLEIDHVQPVALGGRTEVSNLRTLCGAHNRFEARRILEGLI